MPEPEPEFAVVCSCGRSAGLILPGQNPTGKWNTDDPEWRHHADPDDERKTRLWHCGREGHYQAALVPPRALVLILLKLLRTNLEAAEDACRKALDAFGREPVDRDNITEEDAVKFDAICHLVAVVDAEDWAVLETSEREMETTP